jgi:hypothetical protein
MLQHLTIPFGVYRTFQITRRGRMFLMNGQFCVLQARQLCNERRAPICSRVFGYVLYTASRQRPVSIYEGLRGVG